MAPAALARVSRWLGKQGRRKVIRVAALVLNPLLTYVLVLGVSNVLFLAASNEFDPRAALDLTISGCSVLVKPCPESGIGEFGNAVCAREPSSGMQTGTVRVQRNLVMSSVARTFRTSTTKLEYLTVSSTVDCLVFQSRFCAPVCRVDVYVPAENSLHLKVTQATDENSGVATLELAGGISIDQLTASGSRLRTSLHDVAVGVKAKVSTGAAAIEVINSRIASGWLTAKQSNIRVVYHADQTRAGPAPSMVKVDYRATTYDDRVAMSAAEVYDRPIEDVMAECTAGRYLQRILDAYDGDKNGKITSEEFTSGLSSIGKCCGSSCPVTDLCAYKVTPVFIPYGTSFVQASALYETIRNELDYTVVPWCTKTAWLATAQGTNLSDTSTLASLEDNMDYLNLRTDDGTVQVALWNESSAAPFLSAARDAATAEAAASAALDEGDTLSEIVNIDLGDLRMLQSSASPLFDAVRDPYGNGPIDAESEVPASIFAVFYADISPFLNEFENTDSDLRFVYTNEPVYLSVPPSLLSALSFGLLSPEIKHFRVKFAPSRPLQLGNQSDTRDLIGKELFRILVPRFRTSMWGTLVKVDSAGPFHKPSYSRYLKDPATGDVVKAPFVPDGLGKLAFTFSFIIGVIIGLVVISKFTHVMQIHLEARFRNDDARRKVLRARREGGSARSLLSAGDPADGAIPEVPVDEDRYKMHNVLERPVELCDVLFVDPVRRYFSDSLVSFVNQTYHIDERHTAYHTQSATQLRNAGFLLRSPHAGIVNLARSLMGGGAGTKVLPSPALGSKHVKPAASTRLENSLTMSRFLKDYENFCFHENIDMEENVQTVKQRLLVEFGVRTRSTIAMRVAGCRWKETLLNPAATYARKNQAHPPRRTTRQRNYRAYVHRRPALAALRMASDEAIFAAFVQEFCEVTGNVRDFVSFDDLVDADGFTKPGFLTALQRFAAAVRGAQAKSINFNPSDKVFEAAGLKRKNLRVENIRALQPLDISQDSLQVRRFSIRWYILQYLETLIHQLAFAVGPAMLLQLAFSAQAIHASTIGPSMSMHTEDLAVLPAKRNLATFDLIWLLEGAGALAAVCLVICYVLLLFVYLELVTMHPLLQRAVRVSYRAVFTCSLFVLLCFMSMQCVWVLLAAFLHPASFLPMGSALACFLSILAYQHQQIANVRDRVQAAMVDIFNKKIAARIVEACALKLKSGQALSAGLLSITADPKYIFDPNDLFCLIDTVSSKPPEASDGTKSSEDSGFPMVQNAPDQDGISAAPPKTEFALEARAQVANSAAADASSLDATLKLDASKDNRPDVSKDNVDTPRDGEEDESEAEGADREDTKDDDDEEEEEEEDEDEEACGDGMLSREEFDQLFDTLGINVLQSKRDMMFAYCDTNETDSLISREEFLGVWEWLLGQLAGSVVGQGLGLSSFQISLYLFALATVLCLLFAFLLISMAAFNPNGGFSALVQSGIIASASLLSTGATSTFGAAGAAMDLAGSSEKIEKVITKEVEDRIEPETESA